jgi:hypothetical protein
MINTDAVIKIEEILKQRNLTDDVLLEKLTKLYEMGKEDGIRLGAEAQAAIDKGMPHDPTTNKMSL